MENPINCTTVVFQRQWYPIAYAGYTACSSGALSYTEMRIFKDPGAQNAQTLVADAITDATALVSAGKVATASRNTAAAQSLTFQFNADNNQTIAPKGFIVEVIQ